MRASLRRISQGQHRWQDVLVAAIDAGVDQVQHGLDEVFSATEPLVEQAITNVEHATETVRTSIGAAIDETRSSIGAAIGETRSSIGTAIDETQLMRRQPQKVRSMQGGLAWGDAEFADPGCRSMPPLRLRMRSYDVLACRSMEVSWDNQTGERQHWTSHNHPLCGWYEAEKVLPASVTNVCVEFKVHTVMDEFSVQRVDRGNDCARLPGEDGEEVSESFWFNQCEPRLAVDATFELRGMPKDCHVWRAWNAERGLSNEPAPWERWGDRDTRPLSRLPLQVLQAADVAAPPPSVAEDAIEGLRRATQRLVAAAKALQEVRREVLARLRAMDQKQSGQWAIVNSGNSVGAGLAVASAVTLFVAPPVGIGLGLGSVATSTVATAGDAIADSVTLESLRELLCEDDMNAFAVVDLQHAWAEATDHATDALQAAGKTPDSQDLALLRALGAQGVQGTLFLAATTAAIVEELSMAAAVGAESVVIGARAAPVASLALGIAGAVVATGAAVHGWTNTKSLQALLRGRMTDMAASVLSTQRWLSAMAELECSICLAEIALTDEVQCCRDSWHYSHKRCIDQWVAECEANARDATCPLCCCPIAPRAGLLQDLILEDISTLHPHAEVGPKEEQGQPEAPAAASSVTS